MTWQEIETLVWHNEYSQDYYITHLSHIQLFWEAHWLQFFAMEVGPHRFENITQSKPSHHY